jgi:hypothetical protein
VNVLAIITSSISPQTKATVATTLTGSIGVTTLLDMIPGIFGAIASIIGVILSILLTRNAIAKSKQDSKEHDLKMRLMQKALDKPE